MESLNLKWMYIQELKQPLIDIAEELMFRDI